MRVIGLQTARYRNLLPADLSFDDGINVLYGKNAQGKTNLLEALWLFTGGHSFRGAKDAELTAFGEKTALLKLHFFSGGREQHMELTLENGKRRFLVNGVEMRTGAELIGKFCGVIFSPEHLSLVKSGPAMRRGFLDGALCQSRPAYAKDFVLYQRTLKQRNTLLKDISKNPALESTLSVWDGVLAERGEKVMRQRKALLERLLPSVQRIYRGLSQGQEEIGLSYVSTVGSAAQFLSRLEETRRGDLLTGFTNIGPHRDDVEITINGISARLYGSQGQQRSAVLSLKLAEADVMEEITGEKPVILLDDVMSELDRERQAYLLNHVRDRQIFLTCCDPGNIRDLRGGRLFFVEQGNITETTQPNPT